MSIKEYYILCGLAFLLVFMYFICWGSTKWLKISKHKVSFDTLPDFLNGFKILHLSDLHGNSSKKMNLDIWSKIETLDFDLAVITGDIITNNFDELLPHVQGLKALAARAPVYYVEGNHDKPYYRKIAELLRSVGIIPLTNEAVLHMPKRTAESFKIIGVRDLGSMSGGSYKTDGVLSLFENDNTDFRLVLTHEPLLYDEMAHTNAELVLAGHTHGGQVRLPLFPTLYAPRQGIFPKYGDGFYGINGSKLYISKGIGTTVFPLRFWNRPEITVLEMRKNDRLL